MRSFKACLPIFLIVPLLGCATRGDLGLTSKTLPDPSPSTYHDAQKGATVIVTFLFRFKEEGSATETLRRMTVTGVAVAEHKVLTSTAPTSTFGVPEKVIVSVPDYAARQNRFSDEGKIVATSNSGMMLIETTKSMPSVVTISSKDVLEVSSAVNTVDVLNGAIPGVSHAGRVSYAITDKTTFGLLLIDVSTSPSSIGCGVYGSDGSLVALVLSPSGDGSELNYSTVMAISARDVRAFLDAQGVAYAKTEATTR